MTHTLHSVGSALAVFFDGELSAILVGLRVELLEVFLGQLIHWNIADLRLHFVGLDIAQRLLELLEFLGALLFGLGEAVFHLEAGKLLWSFCEFSDAS